LLNSTEGGFWVEKPEDIKALVAERQRTLNDTKEELERLLKLSEAIENL
jgi:hypothetical protein